MYVNHNDFNIAINSYHSIEDKLFIDTNELGIHIYRPDGTHYVLVEDQELE